MIFYIADWHYNHANILAYDNRPFKTVEEMNTALVERWNSVVTPTDTVYVLGDMFWGGEAKAVSVLDSSLAITTDARTPSSRSGLSKSRAIWKSWMAPGTWCCATIPCLASRIISTGGIIYMGMSTVLLSGIWWNTTRCSWKSCIAGSAICSISGL